MPDQAPQVPAVVFGTELRSDCGLPDHEWVRCARCPNEGERCACTGRICCQREYFELFGD